MSSSPLANTNFINGNHPFMDHSKGALPIPPPPSKYPQGVPANYIYAQKPQSLPGSQPPSPSGSMPQYPPPQMVSSYSTSSASSSPSSSSGGYIFTHYRPDRDGCRTPELPDILSTKKKSTWNQK